MQILNKKLLIIIRLLNLGFNLSLIFFTLVSLIWARATNGNDYMPDYLYEFTILISVFIPLILFYFLVKRFIDKLNKKTSSKLLIVIELGFVLLTLVGLLLAQIIVIIDLFDIVIFLSLLFGQMLLLILALDSIKDYKIQLKK